MAGTNGSKAAMKAGRDGYTPKRGRPTKTQVAAIGRSILLVARTRFLEDGYASTSMEAVAAEAGVSKGTLYARYPAKSDLFKAIVADRMAEWLTSERLGVPRPRADMAEYLMTLGTSFLEALDTPEVAAFDRLILAEAARFPELAGEFREQGYLRAVDDLAREIAAHGARTGWPVADPRGIAIAFTSALLGWHREESLVAPIAPDSRAAFVARLVALFVGGRAAW